MIRPKQARLKLSKSQFQHCQLLSEESAKVWNFAKNFFWRTYRKKGIWLSEGALACDALSMDLGTITTSAMLILLFWSRIAFYTSSQSESSYPTEDQPGFSNRAS